MSRDCNIKMSKQLNNFKIKSKFVISINNRLVMLKNISGRPEVILKLLQPNFSCCAKNIRIINLLLKISDMMLQLNVLNITDIV